MRLRYLLLHFHLAFSPAAMKLLTFFVSFLLAVHTKPTTTGFYCISKIMRYYRPHKECEISVCLFTRDCFVFSLAVVFLPLWSLISTVAWASNSSEISSLLPLRAAWCSGDNLQTDTRLCAKIHISIYAA